MDRREFLQVAGAATAGAAALALTACAPNASTAPALGSGSPHATATPAGVQPPTDADWAALRQHVMGSVIRTGDAGYSVARQNFNPRFDTVQPSAVIRCTSASDVQAVIAFCRDHAVALAARSGGHSYAGYSLSPGVVCDVGGMAGVEVHSDGTATIGAGARLIDVYTALAAHGVTIPAGSCPTVGIAGLALGGGVGVIGRKFGLTSDNITEITVVTAGGDVLTCNASDNSDIFWACRGGGGGNFGVVTSLRMTTHTVSAITLFAVSWPWASAHDVVAAWQDWITTLPDEIWSNCHLLNMPGAATPAVSIGGACVGSASTVSAFLTTLRTAVGTPASTVSVGSHALLDAVLIEAGCAGQSVGACRLAPPNGTGTLQREASLGRSDIALGALPSAAIDALIAGVEQRHANPAATTIAGVALDALGGAINRVGARDTAFVHRSARFIAQYNATWPTAAPPSVVQSNVDGVNSAYAAMRPWASGFAYQNYIDPSRPDWLTAYYGANLPRLRAVKAKYDPDGTFRFAQSIPPG